MLNRHLIISLAFIMCLNASTDTFAASVIPATKTTSADVSSTDGSIIYKRKQENNSYPMGASSYENNFLKSLMGVGMQTPASGKTAGTT